MVEDLCLKFSLHYCPSRCSPPDVPEVVQEVPYVAHIIPGLDHVELDDCGYLSAATGIQQILSVMLENSSE